jgi:hypothetical protein
MVNACESGDIEIGIRGTRAIEVLSGLATNERVASPAPTTLTMAAASA